MIQHIARGMVGAVIVDPRDPSALPRADREFVLIQTELYLEDPDNVRTYFERRYGHMVFNGGIFKYDPVHAADGGVF